MLTVKQILDLIAARPTPITQGRSMSLLRQVQRDRQSTGDERRFVEAFAAQTPPKAEIYSHPEVAASTALRLPGQPTGLQPADLAWLQRLPSDPAQVTYADAVQLASFVRDSAPRTSDRRLLDAVWLPVKAVHDLKAAETELANARLPPPTVPSTALNALAEAVGREAPQLDDDEAVARASRLLREALDRRSDERDARITKAQARLETVRAERVQRQALTA